LTSKKLSILLGLSTSHMPDGQMRAAIELTAEVGVAAACHALQLPRSALYRNRAARHVCPRPRQITAPPARCPSLALSQLERKIVLDVLNSPHFANCAPAAIYAQLPDVGRYPALVRTIYRGCCEAVSPCG
jgi:putative transposase